MSAACSGSAKQAAFEDAHQRIGMCLDGGVAGRVEAVGRLHEIAEHEERRRRAGERGHDVPKWQFLHARCTGDIAVQCRDPGDHRVHPAVHEPVRAWAGGWQFRVEQARKVGIAPAKVDEFTHQGEEGSTRVVARWRVALESREEFVAQPQEGLIDRGAPQPFLAAEVVVDQGLGDAAAPGDGGGGGAVEAMGSKLLERCQQNAFLAVARPGRCRGLYRCLSRVGIHVMFSIWLARTSYAREHARFRPSPEQCQIDGPGEFLYNSPPYLVAASLSGRFSGQFCPLVTGSPRQWKSTRSLTRFATSTSEPLRSGGIFDFDGKCERLEEVGKELEDPKIWNNPERAQALGRERAQLDNIVGTLTKTAQHLLDARELLAMAVAENDAATVADVATELARIEQQVAALEFQRMFSGPNDPNSAFMDIQAGAGGTEAQDWASMLLRMYLRWGEKRGFKTELLECTDGEVAGVKSATIHFAGEYAYGWLRTETGVHRLVRKSPFDSGGARHTSFASVFVSPEIDDSFEIDINPADLRTDVYRASGAGGQHVNRTESAVRITHIPTNTVAACQAGRSQHQNRAQAMKMLAAKLYELEIQKRNVVKSALEATKADVGWGSQIRSYVLDQSRIKDLRTGMETSNTGKFLDGDIDDFIDASLKAGL